jgi:hypothetical protein
MKRMSGYYVPNSSRDAKDFQAQFKRSPRSSAPGRPSDLRDEKFQEILDQPRSFPRIIRVSKGGRVVAEREVGSRKDLVLFLREVRDIWPE